GKPSGKVGPDQPIIRPGEILLGAMLAKTLQTQIGDKIKVEDRETLVSGIIESGNMFETASAILPLADLQHIMEQPTKVTLFLLEVEDCPTKEAKQEKVAELARAIEAITDEHGRSVLSANSAGDQVEK